MDTTSALETPHTLITGAPGIGKMVAAAPRAHHHFALQGITNMDDQALDLICTACGGPLSWWQWFQSKSYSRESNCACGERIPRNRFKRGLPDHQRYAVASPGYFDGPWFHATRKENWADAVQSPQDGQLLVHAGSKLSALSRADDLVKEISIEHGPVYIHSFLLTDPSAISPTVYDDMGENWPVRIDEGHAMRICPFEDEEEAADSYNSWQRLEAGYQGAPYYNRYEIPGEISLILHAGLIDLASVKTRKLI